MQIRRPSEGSRRIVFSSEKPKLPQGKPAGFFVPRDLSGGVPTIFGTEETGATSVAAAVPPSVGVDLSRLLGGVVDRRSDAEAPDAEAPDDGVPDVGVPAAGGAVASTAAVVLAVPGLSPPAVGPVPRVGASDDPADA